MKIGEIKRIKGVIEVMTGLRIGAGQDMMEIGGNDNPIVRNPVNGQPYIPGSSLKGKMRSLMEWHLDCLSADGNVHRCDSQEDAKDCPICLTFGISAGEKYELGMTRLIVRDCPLSKVSQAALQTGKPLVEVKSENTINRITAKATPRTMERVVPSTTFDLDIVYRVLDMGEGVERDLQNFRDVVLQALLLVEQDFLGGGGSRGNGRLQFKDLEDEKGNRFATVQAMLEAAS